MAAYARSLITNRLRPATNSIPAGVGCRTQRQHRGTGNSRTALKQRCVTQSYRLRALFRSRGLIAFGDQLTVPGPFEPSSLANVRYDFIYKAMPHFSESQFVRQEAAQ